MWTRLWAGAIDWQPIVMALLPTLLAAWLVASAARRLTRAALKSPLPQLRQRLEDHRRPFGRLRTGIEDPPVIIKILSHLGLSTREPPRAPARRVDLFQTI
jgi:hypothetical protein